MDFTGNLDLVLLIPESRELRVLRNLGNMYFTNGTSSSGLAGLSAAASLLTDDWNGDELNDLLVGLPGETPRLFTKIRGGALTNTPTLEPWPATALFTVGDLNNDLRNDIVFAEGDQLTILFNGFVERRAIPATGGPMTLLTLLDYDNDGWLDILGATANGLRAWRNTGNAGFTEASASLALDKLPVGRFTSLSAADMDQDGDSDLVAAVDGAGIRVFRNQGGDAHHQLQLRLLGTRSNPSGLGLRIELTAGNWRALRTVHQLPIEIGVGHHEKIDTLNVRWFDTLSTDVDIEVERGQQVALIELVRPTGSCPYLYRWDGKKFKFVTDLLGGSPVGLPVAEGRYVEADPDEIVALGPAAAFPPRDGFHVVQITEELREVLYLDQAQLIVADHPPDAEVHPMDKLVPGPPFPPSELVLLRDRVALCRAEDSEGRDVTAAVQSVDQHMVSPAKLRPPQLRGFAEPHAVLLDFGPLEVERPLALALTGWLRFGGGMANMSASRDPSLPFPFPKLEVEQGGAWTAVDVVVGAPCGKTKTIVVDLAGKLPRGAHRLRLSTSFEIHWDRIALFATCERQDSPNWTVIRQAPDRSDLHWRGYSEFFDLPWHQPLTPDYDKVRSWPDWRITPSGWCTRYGPVDELIAQRDGGMALLNGGDELTVQFRSDRLPPIPPGKTRQFFLFTVGWDKDADFHVVHGDRVGPLPWEGMDGQRYGQETRPFHPGDRLNRRYSTRWVGPMAQLPRLRRE
jgi:hypothetical protein